MDLKQNVVLQAWGVRKITLIDHGKVSTSSPLRQSLYKSKDCGEYKALAAVKRLAKIFPAMVIKVSYVKFL